MTLVQAGDIRLATESRGSGDSVLLVSGGVLDMDQWDAQMEALSDGYRVIRFDQRGVGESDKPAGGYTLAQFTQDTLALIETLDLAPCVLVGSSLGALVALEVAALQPQSVRALVLAAAPAGMGGTPIPTETQAQMLAGASLPLELAVAALLGVVFASDYPQTHPELVVRAVEKRRVHSPPPLAALSPIQSAAQYDARARAATVHTPTLVIHGEEDRLSPIANARSLAAHLGSARLVPLPGAGHAVVVEAAEAVTAAVQEFLSSLD